MKYRVLHDFITSAPFDEKSSDHFKDLHKMELLTKFDINLTSFLGVQQALYYGGGGGLRGGSHKIFTNREGGPTIFLLLPGGIKNLTESFIPLLPHSPP